MGIRLIVIKKGIIVLPLFLIIVLVSACRNEYHGRFVEDFNKQTSKYFNAKLRDSDVDNHYFPSVNSSLEKGTKVILLNIDPEDDAGPRYCPEIISEKFTHFGVYSTRLKIPDVTEIQPNIGAVVGYFTYFMDSIAGLSEIDFEWLLADPEIIYIGTWTGGNDNLLRIGRTINLAKGLIYNTSLEYNDIIHPLSDMLNQPETIQPVENYNAASQFYTYGFDWHPDRIKWWVIHPTTADTIVLWDYSGSSVGIPQRKSLYRLNFWHTNNWAVVTRPNSTEKPLYHYELEIDWMSYSPYKREKYIK